MNNNISLTKSDFLLFLEAPRHLWAAKHDLIEKIPSPFETNVMKQGYGVEALAKEYLNKFVLETDENLIFQKTFIDNQFTVRMDILINKSSTDSYELYEFKSGTRVKKDNIYNVTYQFLIINKQIKIDRVLILHLNSEYAWYLFLNLADQFGQFLE